MNNKLKTFLFWIITISFPIIVFGIIEIGLRIGGYNSNAQELFIEAPNDPGFLVSNVDFIERYFPSFVPNIAPNAFRKNKRPNAFRVFVFGGSSTQGFPYNFYYSFAEQLEQKLLLETEGVNVEVINLGMTAVNSYVIHDLSKRVLKYEPDAILIYAGHNEYYGSFGVGSTQFGFSNSIFIKRLILWVKDFRLYQFLEDSFAREPQDTGDQRTMMAKVIQNSDIELEEEIYLAGLDQFEENISDVIERFTNHEIPVYIGTVASNLKDQPPLTDDLVAADSYNRAKESFEAGDKELAFEHFLTAKELDGIRFRAPEKINEIIKALADEYDATLIDVQKLLREQSESGIEDNSLFIDHLHPNYLGHRLIAEELFKELSRISFIKNHMNENIFDLPNSISRFESTYAEVSIARLLVGYPFQKGITVEEELQNFQQIFDEYTARSFTDSLAADASKTLKHTPQVLADVINQAENEADSLAVMEHYYELMKWQLNSVSLIERGIEFAINNRATDEYLANIILQILNDGSYDPRYIDVLASLYLLRNNTVNAEYWLAESERLNPNSARMLYNYGRFHLLKGDTLQSQRYYQRFLQVQQGR